jgi:hypothetical protein
VRYDYAGVVEECIQESNESYQRSPRILINKEVSPTIAGKRESMVIVCFASFYSLFDTSFSNWKINARALVEKDERLDPSCRTGEGEQRSDSTPNFRTQHYITHLLEIG